MSVDEFMEEYWPLDPIFSLDEPAYKQELERRFGKETLAESHRLDVGVDRDESDKSAWDAAFTFAYDTGLNTLVNPLAEVRNRETLRALLSVMDHPGVITDLGCGDGRTSIGLAIYTGAIVRAVDKLPAAINALQRNLDRLPRKYAHVRNRVVPIRADYHSSHNELRRRNQLVVATYQPDVADLNPHLAAIMDKTAIVAHPIAPSADFDSGAVSYFAGNLLREIDWLGREHNIRFKEMGLFNAAWHGKDINCLLYGAERPPKDWKPHLPPSVLNDFD